MVLRKLAKSCAGSDLISHRTAISPRPTAISATKISRSYHVQRWFRAWLITRISERKTRTEGLNVFSQTKKATAMKYCGQNANGNDKQNGSGQIQKVRWLYAVLEKLHADA
ncbi:hypothetical protein M8818_005329 [Zalaria obscura]|uniref:Uncharacterized protein n=1 Tax=Zalaria obscura TaxID=2024903 RepID=A0ACC3SDL9_9PEZI